MPNNISKLLIQNTNLLALKKFGREKKSSADVVKLNKDDFGNHQMGHISTLVSLS